MDKYEEVHEQISCLQVILKRVEDLKLSCLEFGYLKVISFTATGRNRLCPCLISTVQADVL